MATTNHVEHHAARQPNHSTRGERAGSAATEVEVASPGGAYVLA